MNLGEPDVHVDCASGLWSVGSSDAADTRKENCDSHWSWLETGSDRLFVRALELHEFVQSNNKGR